MFTNYYVIVVSCTGHVANHGQGNPNRGSRQMAEKRGDVVRTRRKSPVFMFRSDHHD